MEDDMNENFAVRVYNLMKAADAYMITVKQLAKTLNVSELRIKTMAVNDGALCYAVICGHAYVVVTSAIRCK